MIKITLAHTYTHWAIPKLDGIIELNIEDYIPFVQYKILEAVEND